VFAKSKRKYWGACINFSVHPSNPSLKIDVLDRVKISENEKQNTVELGDVLFTGSSETPDECGMSSVLTKVSEEPLYLNSFCFGFRLFNKREFLPDFLKHLFRSSELRKQIKRTASGVTRFNVSKVKMAEVEIPLPPLEIQREVVEILDKFAQLTAELTAELQKRKKQYEHYRDKLLGFGRASSSRNSRSSSNSSSSSLEPLEH
jgi:type I restriction enzyme S subunit